MPVYCDALSLAPDIIEAIDEELEYQNSLNESGRADGADNGVAGQLVTLTRYVRKAEDAWTDHPGDGAALNEIRKIAASAIRTLILYGCPRR